MNKRIDDVLLNDSVFTPEDCDAIVRELSPGPYEDGKVANNQPGGHIRKSSVRFLPPSPQHEWIFNGLANLVSSLNQDVFGFDITTLEEGFQFTKYEPGDHYSWHADLGGEDERSRRKLSITLQLNDDYEGGNLQFFPAGIEIPRRKGLVAVFPSFLVHRVAPVTAGTRYSLVAWVAGEYRFR